MSEFRFLIDEDTSPAIRNGVVLRRPQIDIRVIGDEFVPPRGTKDPEILDWIEHEGFILVTSNRSTMPQHLKEHLQKGGHIPGIFVLRHHVSFGQIIDDLLLIWEAGELEYYRDRIEYIPL